MRAVDRIKFLSFLDFFLRGRPPWVGCAAELRERLSPDEGHQLSRLVQSLETYLAAKRSQRADEVLMEIVCVTVAMRGTPGAPVAVLSEDRPDLTEKELDRAAYWLESCVRLMRCYDHLPNQQRNDIDQYARSRGVVLPPDPGEQPHLFLSGLARLELVPSPSYHDLRQELVGTYRRLSTEEGHQLAAEIVDLWLSDSEAFCDPRHGRNVVADILLHLAVLVPGSLRGLHVDLVRGGLFRPPELYRDADAKARDELIRLAETDPEKHRDAVGALYCIGDEVVAAAFHRWRKTPPPAYPSYRVGLPAYCGEGWELTQTGERRFLYHPECYELVPADEAPDGDVPGPLGVMTPREDKCRWCARPLVNLFDVDLRDPRLAFAAPGWERLQIAMCARCSAYGRMFTEVDAQGGSRWSELNERPEFIGHDEDLDDWIPSRRVVLGPRRRSPFEAHRSIMYMEKGASQFGGLPMWVVDLGQPWCPKCERIMVFVGQFQWWDIFDEGAEGVTYAFLCQDCGVATTTYEQT